MLPPECKGPPFNDQQEIVKGGGLTFLTADVFLKAAVWRCRELSDKVERRDLEIFRLRNEEVARFRTLRRDVDQIKRAMMRSGGA